MKSSRRLTLSCAVDDKAKSTRYLPAANGDSLHPRCAARAGAIGPPTSLGSRRVTVLGRGDLAPRRRPRRRGRKVLVLLLVVAVAVGGWFGWQALRGDDSADRSAALRPCVQPTHPPAPAAAAAVHVRVLNATKRAGLAHDVAQQLRARGFRLAGVGNHPRRVSVTTVQHPTAALAAAEAVAEQLPEAHLEAGNVKVVTLLIGADFRRLASTQQAAQARAADTRRASPVPSPCPAASS